MLILASASPRRSDLLRGLGLPFKVQPSRVDEPLPEAHELGAPHLYATRLAKLKCDDVACDEIAAHCEPDAVVIAADTIVVLGDSILGKPRDQSDARVMLRQLSGQTHSVFTGICVRRGESAQTACEETRVTFGELSDDFIADYVATGEPMDKAGAYAAQGRGALLIARIEGDYFNVVGLPLRLLNALLCEFDVQVSTFWR